MIPNLSSTISAKTGRIKPIMREPAKTKGVLTIPNLFRIILPPEVPKEWNKYMVYAKHHHDILDKENV